MRLRHLASIWLGTLALAAPASAAGGDLTYFRTYLELTTGGFSAGLTSAALQPDGKVVVAGFAYQKSNADSDWIVARIEPATGALDPGFGQGGVVRIPIDLVSDGSDFANAVAIGPGGRILVAGEARAAMGTDMAVAALTPNGDRDGGFGPQGVRTFSFGGLDRANSVLVDPATGAVAIGGLAGTSPFGFGIVRLDSSGQPLAGFGNAGMVSTSMGGSGADEIDTLLAPGDGTLIAVGTADGGFPEADLALARYDAAGLAGGPTIVPGTERDRASAAVLAGGTIVIGDSTINSSFAQVAVTRAVSATTFQAVPGFAGGQPFGVPSAYRDLALTPGGTVLGLGMAPFGGALDDFQLVTLAADGTPAAPARSYPGSADKQSNAAALVPVPALARLILVGSENDVPAVGSVDQSGGGTTVPPTHYDLAVAVQRSPDYGYPPIQEDSAGAQQIPFVEISRHPPAFHPPHAALVWEATVANNGPDGSPATRLSIDATLPGTALEPLKDPFDDEGTCLNVRSRTGVTPFWLNPPKGLGHNSWTYHFPDPTAALNCDVPPLAPGQSVKYRFDVHMTQLAPLRAGLFILDVPCGGDAEANICANNRTQSKLQPVKTALAAWTAMVGKANAKAIQGKAVPATAKKAGAATIARAVGIRRVQVAIARVERGAPAVIAKVPQCRWLENAKGRTVARTPIHGHCPRPVWLKAKGTKRWRLALRKRLPKGTYEVLARATDSRGRTQSVFAPPSDVRFTVR